MSVLISGDNDGRSKWYKRSYELVGKTAQWDREVRGAQLYLEAISQLSPAVEALEYINDYTSARSNLPMKE